MLKVFLAEDESVVREGLRDNISWQQYGFEFAGEATDGEMALPMIRKLQPDLLITDIKMPFMDGLSLCHIVHQEFPNMKMIIISGYDDFEYARRAISEGVEQYLSKPVTRRSMEKALQEVKKKIDNEREQEDYVRRFQLERQEYEQFYRRDFFEQAFAGNLSVEDTYAQAQKLSMNISGPYYNILMFNIAEDETAENYDTVIQRKERVIQYFLRFSQYIFVRWSIHTYCVLIKGEKELVHEYTRQSIIMLKETFSDLENAKWYVSSGEPVERFSRIGECYAKVSHLFSYRFLVPDEHILTDGIAEIFQTDNDGHNIGNMDINKVDPRIIREFLQNGQKDEIHEFVSNYFENLKEVLQSRMFRDYLMLNIQFTTMACIKEAGGDTQKLEEMSESVHGIAKSGENISAYVENLLCEAIAERDKTEIDKGGKLIKEALAYIERNYCDSSLALNSVATAINVTPNYFSALFSQSMKMTFIEYVTQKRIERAKQLLKTKGMHTAEVAAEVGYRDSHYFSFVFKKTTGMSPREYRATL